MILDATAPCRAEEIVEQHVVVGDVPVEWQIPIVVIAHGQRAIFAIETVGIHKSVHAPVVVLAQERADVMVEILDGAVPQMKWLDTGGILWVSRVNRKAGAFGNAI